MCDRSYPKKLAFQYLEDLKNEFERVNGAQIETAARPYAFIKFDTFIQKTKKIIPGHPYSTEYFKVER